MTTKEKIYNLSKDLFNDKTAKDCLVFSRGKLYFKDKELTKEQVVSLVAQANELKNMDVFRLLMNEMKYLCNKKMYYESESTDDILFGKAALWFIDVLEKKITNLSNLSTWLFDKSVI